MRLVFFFFSCSSLAIFSRMVFQALPARTWPAVLGPPPHCGQRERYGSSHFSSACRQDFAHFLQTCGCCLIASSSFSGGRSERSAPIRSSTSSFIKASRTLKFVVLQICLKSKGCLPPSRL